MSKYYTGYRITRRRAGVVIGDGIRIVRLPFGTMQLEVEYGSEDVRIHILGATQLVGSIDQANALAEALLRHCIEPEPDADMSTTRGDGV